MTTQLTAYLSFVRRYLLFFLPGICCCIPCNSRANGEDTLRYTVRHYTDENGLPQNSIRSVCPDEAGFYWLATENGLVRFDGNNFRVYNHENTGIRSPRIANIRRSGSGLYAVTNNSEVLQIGSGSAWPVPGNPLPPEFNYYTGADKRLHFRAANLPNVANWEYGYEDYSIPLGRDSSFIIKRDSLCFQYGNRRSPVRYFPQHHPQEFMLVDGAVCYFGKPGQVLRITEKGAAGIKVQGDLLKNPAFHPGGEVPEIYWNGNSGNVLLNLGQCLYLVNRQADNSLRTRLILTGFDLKQNNIISTWYDPQPGRLFLGSLTGGLFLFIRQQFQTLHWDEHAREDVFYAQQPWSSSSVITPQGYLLGKDQHILLPALHQRHLPDRYTILIDSAGYIWSKAGKTLYKYDRNGQQVLAQWEFQDLVTQLYRAPDGRIWVGTRQQGLYYIQSVPGKGEREMPRPFLDQPKGISWIQQAGGDTLWVGTDEGLYRVPLNGHGAYPVAGMGGKYVRSISQSKPDEVWITTEQNGIFLYAQGALTRMPLDRNRYMLTTHCIMPDSLGNFWITTNKGLFQLKREDLLRYARGAQREVFYLYYNRENGFSTNEFNGGCEPCAVRLANGQISLPSLNGLVWFDPGSIRQDFPDKALFIDRVEIDREPAVLSGDALRLPDHFERLQLVVSTPYQGEAYNLRIEYALIREDKDPVWLPLDNTRTITLSGLSSGHYRLSIRKLNGFGKDNYGYRNIGLIVAPAFYETWWFYGLVFLLLLLCIRAYTRFRLRYIQRQNQTLEKHITERTQVLQETLTELRESEEQLRHQNRIQERLITVIAHDIKSPLRYTAQGARNLYDDLVRLESSSEALAHARMIYESGYRIYHLTDNLLQYIKLHTRSRQPVMEVVDLQRILEEGAGIFRDIATAAGTQLTLSADGLLQIRSNGRLLGIILHNLLDNATKFTQGGEILVSVTAGQGYWELCVRDTGYGMPEEMVAWCNYYTDTPGPDKEERSFPWHTGLGLIMVKELAAMIGGRLFAQSRPGETVARIRFRPAEEI